jgi:hypothetical protein
VECGVNTVRLPFLINDSGDHVKKSSIQDAYWCGWCYVGDLAGLDWFLEWSDNQIWLCELSHGIVTAEPSYFEWSVVN